MLQVLNNLLSNAIKFTKEGKIILRVILVSKTENHLVIRFEVEDTGIGIGPDKLKFVFEKFTQASGDTTRKYGGSGLGLAISKAWGIECEEATDGEEVLSKLANEKFDLILMDLDMPNMDGI